MHNLRREHRKKEEEQQNRQKTQQSANNAPMHWKDEHEEGKTQMVQLVKVNFAMRRQTFAPTN